MFGEACRGWSSSSASLEEVDGDAGASRPNDKFDAPFSFSSCDHERCTVVMRDVS